MPWLCKVYSNITGEIGQSWQRVDCLLFKRCAQGYSYVFILGRARLRSRTYDFQCSIEKRRGKLGRNVSFKESYVLYWLNIQVAMDL